MRILAINSVPYGSTGNIMKSILKKASKDIAAETLSLYGAWVNGENTETVKHFGYYFENKISGALSKLTGYHNVWSCLGTHSLIETIEKINPDVIHLHNLHLWVINLPMLFNYIKKHNKMAVWTLHDCWAFTGHCPHFDMIGCDKWKTGCYDCPQYKSYPSSMIDRSKKMYKLKREWFTGIENMTIVTPSQWLADLVGQSFLKDYPVKVINNGIDLSIFKPTESNFREKYQIGDKYVVLGVAFGWGERKGLDVFIELSKRLPENYQIVLVGTDDNVDKQLPGNIISIHRTQNQQELAEIYTAADLFVNPTREEVLGMVNIESLACGTPVVTFKTGGSPECIDETCGSVVEKNDIDGMKNEVIRICENKPFSKEACLRKANTFDMNDKFAEYVNLYKGSNQK